MVEKAPHRYTKNWLTRGPEGGSPAVGRAFGPILLWALRALNLLSPPAREPTEARRKFPSQPLPPCPFPLSSFLEKKKKILYL